MMKSARHAQILKLIAQYDIETQEELAGRLQEAGFSVTQATVSRDIRELQLSKTRDEGGAGHYTAAHPQSKNDLNKYARVLKDAFVSVDAAGNLLVVKTVAGMAMAAAAAFDELNWKEIVGCIAGDNTIMCAIKSPEQAVDVMNKLRKMLGID